MKFEKYIRTIPDFPKQGILFYDITTLLNNKKALKGVLNAMTKNLKDKGIDYIVAPESRGFIFSGALSYKLGCGFVPVRKPGKLPYKTYSHTYSLEYGSDTLEIHQDAFPPNSNVLIFDDLLATGGTTIAMINLVKKLSGNIVGIAYMIELTALAGRDKIGDYPIYTLIKF